eukprot:TRINITY_DN35439_c0_g1_i1.p1 TRINITY_DN35439_c0_g1~~TRINITY_DN35439_c0_g1_i1.p1  ORF type:complete len:115 (-),score=4.66 TRINITY_DN35439_c0_g1_i1:98-442(-)
MSCQSLSLFTLDKATQPAASTSFLSSHRSKCLICCEDSMLSAPILCFLIKITVASHLLIQQKQLSVITARYRADPCCHPTAEGTPEIESGEVFSSTSPYLAQKIVESLLEFPPS